MRGFDLRGPGPFRKPDCERALRKLEDQGYAVWRIYGYAAIDQARSQFATDGRTTMQTTMALEDIKVSLPELLDSMTPGDEVILTRNQQPVGKLLSEAPQPALKQRPGPGLGKGMITFIAPDFDAPLDCMKEYMQ